MNGVPELQARIEALSSEITLQKQLLRNLERDKSLVQRQLNAVPYPDFPSKSRPRFPSKPSLPFQRGPASARHLCCSLKSAVPGATSPYRPLHCGRPVSMLIGLALRALKRAYRLDSNVLAVTPYQYLFVESLTTTVLPLSFGSTGDNSNASK
ncbi:hypothetical protein C8R47DRAFT_301258 [Mycena vitilis]|nr:hypothetical protein C8R47DRAFT_301258 [Mycena vitilis]